MVALARGTDGTLKLFERQIDNAIRSGATVLLGGKRVDRPGYFLEPTILTNIQKENSAYFQEFFAPVALIFRVKTDEEAVKLATTLPMDWVDRSSPRTSSAARGLPVRSTPAWSSSTRQHGPLRTCRSAASRTPVMVASSLTSASANSSTRS